MVVHPQTFTSCYTCVALIIYRHTHTHISTVPGMVGYLVRPVRKSNTNLFYYIKSNHTENDVCQILQTDDACSIDTKSK